MDVWSKICVGRSKRTTAHQDRQTALLAKRNRMSSAVTLNREFRAASGVRISTQMVETDFMHLVCMRKPAVRPPLTARYRNCRLQFARRHANWGVRRIRPVFTDESRFCLDHDKTSLEAEE